MGCEIEGVARTDTPDAQRLVTAVNRIGIAQQVAQHERSSQPRTAEIEGFEKRGVEREGVAEALLVREGIEHLPRDAALPRDARRTAQVKFISAFMVTSSFVSGCITNSNVGS